MPFLCILMGVAGCGSDGPVGPTEDAGTGDSGPADEGVPADTGPIDMGMMTGNCANVVCDQPFFRCVNGACAEFPRCFTVATCPAGDFCTGLHCVPPDVDVDGDGYPAAEDCDEANDAVNPGATEICGLLDDNCDGAVDEGDTQALCANDPAGQTCMGSICCPTDTFNFDNDPGNGCECASSPAPGTGASCAGAISVGSISDAGAGAATRVQGNLLPTGREVWYRFSAVDGPDTACDKFKVRARFTQNPGNRYRLNLYRGCGTPLCDAEGVFTTAEFNLNHQTAAGRRGQCPCGANSGTLNTCGNDTQDFMVRVRWADTSAPTCEEFEIEFSNGM